MPADQPHTAEEPVQGRAALQPDGAGVVAQGVPQDAVQGAGAPVETVDEAEETRRLEEESEIAADYLEELLDIADLDGDIEIEVRQNRTFLSVVTEQGHEEDLQMLVGRHGEVLDSLQELVRLSVLAATGNRSRLILDIAGHRVRRAETLRDMAQEAVDAARSTGRAFHLKPLSPYERKLVHDFVAELGFHSESEGEGPNRHIVVTGQDPAAAADATADHPSEGDAALPEASEGTEDAAGGTTAAPPAVEPIFNAPQTDVPAGHDAGNEGA